LQPDYVIIEQAGGRRTADIPGGVVNFRVAALADRLLVALAAAVVAVLPAIAAQAPPAAFDVAAQRYPVGPIRMVVPFTPGSASDILARLIGPKLLESWGQQIVVDNRPSAGGTVAGSIVASAVPDGYTMMLTSSGFAGSAALYDKLPYDSLKDFSGVAQVVSTPLVLVVGPALGVKSVKELIALAQQKSGQFNFSSSGIGSGTHYAGELFKLAAGMNAVHVPYRGTPEAINDVISGRIQFMTAPVLPAMALVKSGRLTVLGVTTRERMALLPDVPTIAEAALPGFEYDGWYGILTPSKTPRAIIDKMSAEVARILKLPDVAEKILNTGAVPKSSTPQEFDTLVREEIVMRGKVFKAAGVKPE
jgi:tripartite-type tricarboxylate transporter receptor subunit TctC